MIGWKRSTVTPSSRTLESGATIFGWWTKKAGPGGDNQFCNNCALYQPIDDEWGKCSIFPGKKVKGAGWCNAWVTA